LRPPGQAQCLPDGDAFRLSFAAAFSVFLRLRHAKLFQNQPQRAELGEAELEEVEADKEREEEEILVDKKRVAAAVEAQGQAEEDEESGNAVNPIGDDHNAVSILWLMFRPPAVSQLCFAPEPQKSRLHQLEDPLVGNPVS
jgi:hypothetical protein